QLVSADAVLSHWGSQAIAHAMISFGFDDGRHLVFSVEIRKRRGQKFSSIGGFFKNFESILIASPESDIVRVRTNMRGEDDYLYPLSMSRDAMRALFLSYT
ncbi:lipoprotein N-acyltransferase Lnb domain-containing protein, partial [Thermolongibacillus altinsuensis]|uniref:lipoprotein N-acyltransferase Lnb domain-containing protein n=1 Tax=Thermolongibacillus altinsuensis TaxID=575256 RepID=UPI002553DB42